MKFKEVWKSDKYRKGFLPSYQYWFRVLQCYPTCLFGRIMFRLTALLYHCDIPSNVKIGKGLYLGHPYNIVISGEAIIGENCNLHKGVTIGQENRGHRKGAPIIGSSVWIGINAAVVGNIHIGDDVLIAPNTYVNCDVPSHSIVLGNPCIIKSRENATQGYIHNKI